MNEIMVEARVAVCNGGFRLDVLSTLWLTHALQEKGGKEECVMTKQLAIAGAYGGLLLALMGCSVGMALSGKEEPNLGAFRVGSPRGEVELQLGSPVSSVTN